MIYSLFGCMNISLGTTLLFTLQIHNRIPSDYFTFFFLSNYFFPFDLMVQHVLDASAPNLEEHRSTVLQVLQQIGVPEDKIENMIEVWNKVNKHILIFFKT